MEMIRTELDSEAALAAFLEEKIESGHYRPGDKIPSMRGLADEFGVTAYAAHNCLKRLQRRGLVTLRHGSGAYVADRRLSDRLSRNWEITVFSGGGTQNSAGYLAGALAGIQNCALEQHCPVTLRRRDYYEFFAPEPALETAVGTADGLIMLGEYDYGKVAFPPELPVVGIEMADTMDGRVSPVSLDPLAAAELAVRFFQKRQVRRVRVFHLEGAPVATFRAECFRMLFRAFGEVSVEPHRLRAPAAAPEEDAADTGLLFCSGTYCEFSIAAYRRSTGRELTDDCAVLSIDGKSLVMPGYTPVPVITIDWKLAGEAAFAELVRRLESPSTTARRISLVPHLIEP